MSYLPLLCLSSVSRLASTDLGSRSLYTIQSSYWLKSPESYKSHFATQIQMDRKGDRVPLKPFVACYGPRTLQLSRNQLNLSVRPHCIVQRTNSFWRLSLLSR